VFLTAIISPTETGGEATQIGGFPFLAKPVDTKTLIDCIEEHLVVCAS
jgi:FixJ family two-component response regulator